MRADRSQRTPALQLAVCGRGEQGAATCAENGFWGRSASCLCVPIHIRMCGMARSGRSLFDFLVQNCKCSGNVDMSLFGAAPNDLHRSFGASSSSMFSMIWGKFSKIMEMKCRADLVVNQFNRFGGASSRVNVINLVDCFFWRCLLSFTGGGS